MSKRHNDELEVYIKPNIVQIPSVFLDVRHTELESEGDNSMSCHTTTRLELFIIKEREYFFFRFVESLVIVEQINQKNRNFLNPRGQTSHLCLLFYPKVILHHQSYPNEHYPFISAKGSVFMPKTVRSYPILRDPPVSTLTRFILFLVGRNSHEIPCIVFVTPRSPMTK